MQVGKSQAVETELVVEQDTKSPDLELLSALQTCLHLNS